MSYEVKKYYPEKKDEWNRFIAETHNATFLHNRDYMDYHARRFDDYSLMIYKGTNLRAVLPAHKTGDVLFAHGGLTYADFLFYKKLKTAHKLEIIADVMKYLKKQGFKKLKIKEIPSIFHSEGNEINNYIYARIGSQLRLKPFFIIDTQNPYKINQNRHRNIKKMSLKNLEIKENDADLDAFWKIVQTNLRLKHQTNPVHTIDEIKLLKGRFQKNIKLYGISLSGQMLAGVLIFHINNSIHFQYIQATNDEKYRNSVDLLIDFVIKRYYGIVRYISFGSSDTPENNLQSGLVYWKESFGAKVINQMFFEIDLNSEQKLADIL